MNWQLTTKIGKRKGASWPIGEGALLVGRSKRCDVTVPDPHVSREQFRLIQRDGKVLLAHLSANHPTLVNGRTVSEVVVNPGDEINVGSVTFIVTVMSEDEQVTPGLLDAHTPVTMPVRPGSVVELSVAGVAPQAKPRDIRDLATLHDLAMQLGAHCTEAETIETVVSFIVRNVAVSACYWLRSDPAGSLTVVHPPNHELSESLIGVVQEELKSGLALARTVLATEGDGPERDVFFVRFCVRNNSFDLVCLECERPSSFDGDSDIGFVLAILRTAEPYLANVANPTTEVDALARDTELEEENSPLVGRTPGIKQVRRVLAMAARAELPVLIQGETGTGKELAARLLYQLSARSDKPLIAVNCAALPDSLFESEFFGHEKGAFTGASAARDGLMKQADGGVLFLDELPSLSLQNQARLLRAIETGAFRPVGGRAEDYADVWVIAASNRDMYDAVAKGEFREDLYYRLRAIDIVIPPLRERREDIPLLAEKFMEEFARQKNTSAPTLGKKEFAYLKSLAWPGNVRELRNRMQTLVALHPGKRILVDDLRSLVQPSSPLPDSLEESVQNAERDYISRVLGECGGRISTAAERLGMHRNTLRKKMQQYGLGK